MKREPQTKYQAIRDIVWAAGSNRVTKAEWMRVNRACRTLGLTNGETEQVLYMVELMDREDGVYTIKPLLVRMGGEGPMNQAQLETLIRKIVRDEIAQMRQRDADARARRDAKYAKAHEKAMEDVMGWHGQG